MSFIILRYMGQINCTKKVPKDLKNVTPAFKKDNPVSARNYRPASVLLTVSKIF